MAMTTAFVAGPSVRAAPTSVSASLRGSQMPNVEPMAEGLGARCGLALAGLAAVGAVVAPKKLQSKRVLRSRLRAEPATAAAAAAAAAKAAAGAKASVAGAKAAGAATAAGAGTGKSLQDSEDVPPSPSFDPATQPGVTEPLGYFDPAGFCKKGDEAGFRNLRAAEIKHGRVAMMAAVGAVAQHYIKFPGFDGVPAGLAAVATPPGTYGFAALFAAAGLLELGAWTEDASKEPGNFGDPAGLGQYTPEMRDRELNNGRMAMFAALGIVAADLLTGKDGIEQLGL